MRVEDGGDAVRPGRDQRGPQHPAQHQPGRRGARHLQQPLLRPRAGHGVRQVRLTPNTQPQLTSCLFRAFMDSNKAKVILLFE